MAGVVVGIDMTEALLTVPAQLDREFAQRLFTAAEGPFCAARLEYQAERSAGDGAAK